MKEVDPKKTKRAAAFAWWMQAPMPMVTLFQTMDVTNLVRWCRKRGWGFHMLMCWCIGCAAAQMEDFSSGAGTEKRIPYRFTPVVPVPPYADGWDGGCPVPRPVAERNADFFQQNQGDRKAGIAFRSPWFSFGFAPPATLGEDRRDTISSPTKSPGWSLGRRVSR